MFTRLMMGTFRVSWDIEEFGICIVLGVYGLLQSTRVFSLKHDLEHKREMGRK